MLDWNKPYILGSATIGIVELMPRITFTIRRVADYRYNKETHEREIIKESFGVNYKLDGNQCGTQFYTRQEVEQYLERQKLLLPQYQELIQKRDALSKRIRPLNAKWFKLADSFLELAKE